jgi:hypothetical protein
VSLRVRSADNHQPFSRAYFPGSQVSHLARAYHDSREVGALKRAIGDLLTRCPNVVTPGSKMPKRRVDNAADLAALLRFLERATG